MEKNNNNESPTTSSSTPATPQPLETETLQRSLSTGDLISKIQTPPFDPPIPSHSLPPKHNWKKYLIIFIPIIILLLYYIWSQKGNFPISEIITSLKTEEANLINDEVDTNNLSRGIYAVHEGTILNVYSSSLDAMDKEIILSKEIGETNLEPSQTILATVSPNGDYLAYKYPASNNLTIEAPSVVTILGITNKQEIARIDNVISFSWSRDNKRLQFTRRIQTSRSNGTNIEAPLYPSDTREYYTFDIVTKQEIKEKNNLYGEYRYVVNINDNEVVTVSHSAYGGIPNRLFVYNTATNKETELDMLGNEQLSTAITNERKTRTIVSLLPKNWGIKHSCNIYEIRNYRLFKLVKENNYDCTLGRGDFYWNGNNEFYYSKGTGPKGRISTSETTKSGIYVLSSIYRYNLNSNTDNVVLQGNENFTYSIYGLLSGKALVVNERSGTIDEMTLQFRDLNGKNPVNLVKASGNDTPYFIGWAIK